ncbi:hypothetical protein M501DRAFT_1061956 [Patellaria atrata CBS 101060]|nr:hypothetical protein M501DRAFT_1061956 [Patellaria atrata CBS 101060]
MAESYNLWDLIDPEKTSIPLQEPTLPIRNTGDRTLTITGEPYLEAFEQYKHARKQFERKQEKLGLIRVHIIKTVDRAFLLTLKATTQVKKTSYHSNIIGARSSIHAATTLRIGAISLQTYTEAKSLDLPDVAGYRAQKDLLRAFKHLEPAQTALMGIRVFKAQEAYAKARH